MSKVRFELNRAGVRELMQSAEMKGIIEEETQKILNRAGAGKGYDANVTTKQTRVVGKVWAETIQAKRSNAKHNTLLKALNT